MATLLAGIFGWAISMLVIEAVKAIKDRRDRTAHYLFAVSRRDRD
jgi:hypothetical protein